MDKLGFGSQQPAGREAGPSKRKATTDVRILRRVRSLRPSLLIGLAVVLAGAILVGASAGTAQAAPSTKVQVSRSFTKGSDGQLYWVTNHLVGGIKAPQLKAPVSATAASSGGPATAGNGKEYLLVWAGDQNVADTTSQDIKDAPLTVSPVKVLNEDAVTDPPAPDFLAVIDATPTSSTYGKVVNTATVGPLVENEPHHMQYLYHKGDSIFAGGLFSSATYVFDVSKLPDVSIKGVSLPTDTLGGSIPDAFWTLPDHTAYGTYMGGPVVPGPTTYSDGSTRVGNGYGGSPGEIVHFDQNGKVLSQTPAANPGNEDPATCVDLPTIPGNATCANPHGIQARPDLNRMVTSDYAEPRDIILDPVKPPDPLLFRPTVRIWDTSKENSPKLVSTSELPDGPRVEQNPGHEEERGIMEDTVTNRPQDKGAFAESMCGGVIYYTPDITNPKPVWREVFDDTTASKVLNPNFLTEGGGCDGGGWVQTDPTDHYLYHAVIGRNPGALGDSDPGVPKMVYELDISKLIASGENPSCNVNTIDQVYDGGSAPDCPTVTSVQPLPDGTSGGPHWGTEDNFVKGSDGLYSETSNITRIAVSNYFVARTGVDGNHKVCILNVAPGGKLSIDTKFRDQNEGTPCVDFNRTSWPQGKTGDAKPHSELFVVPDASLK
jgi:hypothetical protein